MICFQTRIIYTRKDLKATGVTILNNNPYSVSVWCTINLMHNRTPLVGCIYRSPNSTQENNIKLTSFTKPTNIKKI